jgi:hypothetical protein
VVNQGVTAELAENGYFFQAGMHEIAERKVNNSGKPAKRHCRFRTVIGKHVEFINPASREDHGQSVVTQFHKLSVFSRREGIGMNGSNSKDVGAQLTIKKLYMPFKQTN